MSKHTEGPWRLHGTERGETLVAAHDNNNRYKVRIAVCGPRDKADARLIAAAPDMLAALQEVQLHIENALKVGASGPGYWEDLADANVIAPAIAKATGAA